MSYLQPLHYVGTWPMDRDYFKQKVSEGRGWIDLPGRVDHRSEPHRHSQNSQWYLGLVITIRRELNLKQFSSKMEMELWGHCLPAVTNQLLVREHDTEILGKELPFKTVHSKGKAFRTSQQKGADSVMCLQTLENRTFSDALLWTDNGHNPPLPESVTPTEINENCIFKRTGEQSCRLN